MIELFKRLVREHSDKFELIGSEDNLYDRYGINRLAEIHNGLVDKFIAVYPFISKTMRDVRLDEYKGTKQLVYQGNISETEKIVTTCEELEKIALEHHENVIKTLKKLIKSERIKAIREL